MIKAGQGAAFKGLLEIENCTIDISQFWPGKESDGDTVKVDVSKATYSFKKTPTSKPISVTAIKNGYVIKKGSKSKPPTPQDAVIKKNLLNIRIEHIDAAELHYNPQIPGCKNYRQHYGESGALAFHALCALCVQIAPNIISCKLFTYVDKPSDIFDCYGRFIGEIELTVNRKKVNSSEYMVKKGYAFPAFYDSASVDEINLIFKASQVAQTRTGLATPGNVWQEYSKDLSKFDPTMVFRKTVNPVPNIGDDKGPVIFPKLFRRQCTWYCKHTGQTISAWLWTQKDDKFYKRTEFIAWRKNGGSAPKKYGWKDVVASNDTLKIKPEDMVFIEASSVLVDKNGKKIESWN